MSKILCPVDFSPTSLNAIEFATILAEKNQAVLHLVNVFTEHEFNTIVDLDEVTKSYKELLAMANAKLEGIAAAVMTEGEKKGLLECETEIALGDLKDTVTTMANSGDYEMVVMGTTGIGKSVFIGSNTSYVVEKSNIPVLSVPDESKYSGFRKIIYATDIQEEDKIKVQDVVSIATLFDSRITVLHLNEYQSLLEKSVIKDFFNELDSFVRYDKISFDSIDYAGNLSEGLLDYLNSNNGDLLVVYSKHRNYLESLLHRSVSKRLSVISEKPILVLK